MSPRRTVIVAALSLAAMALHPVLLRAMAHGHVAHVLLGAGNSAPPLPAAALAVSLVLARTLAILLAPGALLACAVSLAAGALARRRAGEEEEAKRGGAGVSPS